MKRKAPNEQLRPVGARALKSAGDTLRPYLSASRVLDLFAGQGRFAEMALEEDAQSVVCVEKHPGTARAIAKTLSRWPGRFEILEQDVLKFLETPQAFDVIFADPPFDLWKDASFAERLFTGVRGCLADESIFLVKSPSRMLLSGPFPGFSLWKQSQFGESALTYYRVGTRDEERN